MTSTIVVTKNILTIDGAEFRCAIGKGGFTRDKREGDGCTPTGTFLLRECWYRLDRFPPPKTGLPVRIIRENDGWCDDAASPDYNRHVKLPCRYSHEKLWRDDHVYDLIIPLGYNDDPVIPGKGSAIFMHVVKDDYAATEGCVALALMDLWALLPHFTPQTRIEIAA